MARTRQLSDLRDDAYKRADMEGATDRHPTADVTRYVNEGCTELWDLLIAARGPEFYEATPSSITTTADTISYSLPATFYALIGVRVDDGSTGGETLTRFDPQEEPALRDPQASGGWPTHYDLRRTTAGANSIVILPLHDAGLTITVRYAPCFTDLSNNSDTFDGINGWEEYAVLFAAKCMCEKDDEGGKIARLDAAMDRMRARISALAGKRDMYRARRVKDVRGPNGLMNLRRWW